MHQHSNHGSLASRNSDVSEMPWDRSNNSYHSYDTSPTDYSSSTRPPLGHYDTCAGRLENTHSPSYPQYDHHPNTSEASRSSIDTYASTIDVDDNYLEEEFEHQRPQRRPPQSYAAAALPATPADFAELFPSPRQLSIRHDDSTDDGNMNLRLDTTVNITGGRSQDITLFHLRMHDLKKREFSLRRYCRDSGREVCHSVRKYQQSTADSRPGFGRSLSNAIAALRSMSESKSANTANLKRSDSGYGSILSRQSLEVDQESGPAHGSRSKMHSPIPTNTTKLEFSNYSQVEVKRRGMKQSKRYDFEYWGTSYSWKRVISRDISSAKVSYHLYRANQSQILAHIEPEYLSAGQAHEEWRKGGWVPPCTMWIDDPQIIRDQNETADVIVASGLIALVDDCIKQRFHPTPKRQFVIPVPKVRLDVDYVGTKDLFKGVIHRSPKYEASSRRSASDDDINYDI